MKISSHILKGFSIIEVMIGIFVFTLWLTSIYVLLVSSLNANEYNKNAIIASNLAREQVELIRNIRDTNYTQLKVWRQKNPSWSYSPSDLFELWKYYRLENDTSTWVPFSTRVDEIFPFVEWKTNLSWMDHYRLCLNNFNYYTYDCSVGNVQTPFYRYLYIEAADDGYWNMLDVGDGFKITSKVIWYKKWYHEYDIKTIITDWRRI